VVVGQSLSSCKRELHDEAAVVVVVPDGADVVVVGQSLRSINNELQAVVVVAAAA
jgi:hypothetical protein